MSRIGRAALAAALLLASVAGGQAQAAAPPTATAAGPEARFAALADAEYRWRRTVQTPDEDAGVQGDGGLPDVGPAAQAAKLARWTATLDALNAIDPRTLSAATQVDYAVYHAQIAALLAAQRFRDYERPFNADSSFWGDVAARADGSFRTEADYRAFLALLGQVPRFFDQNIANMRAGLVRGFTQPRLVLAGRDAEIAAVADAAGAEATGFFTPFRTMPATIPPATQAALRAAAVRLIGEGVIPAHARLLRFVRTDYLPGATDRIAAADLPDGRAYYQSKLREFTTQELTPAQIHALGLAEIARIRAGMRAVMADVRFTGDLPAFLHYLRTDPRFYPKTPQALLDRAAWIAKTFDGKAADFFGRLPRRRFAIKPVPAGLAPFYTGGRGGPGIYLVNTYDLSSRPFYQMVALTLHESAPGHAFQMPLAAENKALPAYRRDEYLSAYGEGWALYCEELGRDMGMYGDPYDRFGMLSYQAWRAARLVVDTGLHAQGWSRAQAEAYLRDNTALSNHEIETEVRRYIAWPGQAVSYYVGKLMFERERRRAEAALGPRFNIRAWHDAMLQLGSVPLGEIARRTDQLIAAGGKGPYPDEE